MWMKTSRPRSGEPAVLSLRDRGMTTIPVEAECR
jgi:hypothetical protein